MNTAKYSEGDILLSRGFSGEKKKIIYVFYENGYANYLIQPVHNKFPPLSIEETNLDKNYLLLSSEYRKA